MNQILLFPFVLSFLIVDASISRSYRFDNQISIHYFMGETIIDVASYIIELQSKLVLIDSQLATQDANEFLAFAKNLKKPIDRIIITHAHLDHHLGSEVFKNIAPIYALEETIREITSISQFVLSSLEENLKGVIPTFITFPNRTLREGSELIDGVIFTFTKFLKTESPTNLLVSLPALKVMFAGDLVFNQIHFYLADKNFDNWINVLKGFQKNYNFYSVFQSHGLPTTSSVFQENINYLQFAKEAYSISPNFDLFKWRMMTKFNYYKDESILDLAKDYLYPK